MINIPDIPKLNLWQIAIDGPAGVGKSTVAKLVAAKLNFRYIDTGAMYRAVTWLILTNKVPLSDEQQIYNLVHNSSIMFKSKGQQELVFINEIDITSEIRQGAVNQLVSQVSAQPLVRQVLIARQKLMAYAESTVMDGRDIGTVVLPNATLKIFLEASLSERAKRRYNQLIQSGFSPSLQEIESAINLRDEQDKIRLVSPLIPATGATIINTDDKSISEVVTQIVTSQNEIEQFKNNLLVPHLD